MLLQKKAAGMTEDEKKAVDAWIQANGLNQYGDDATRMYTGERRCLTRTRAPPATATTTS